MKNALIILLCCLLLSACNNDNQTATTHAPRSIDTQLLVLRQPVDSNDAMEIFSRKEIYCQVTGADTLDFKIEINEYKSDSTWGIYTIHDKPILFTQALYKIKNALPAITKKFPAHKLVSLYFKEPFYYPDLVTDISKHYEEKFGRKNISYAQLDNFLLNDPVTQQVNALLPPYHKKAANYGLEKFHLMDKAYLKNYISISDADLERYPDFMIYGMGTYIGVKNTD